MEARCEWVRAVERDNEQSQKGQGKKWISFKNYPYFCQTRVFRDWSESPQRRQFKPPKHSKTKVWKIFSKCFSRLEGLLARVSRADNKREGRCKHKDNTRYVIEEEIEALGIKPLRRLPSGKQSTRKCSWDTWIAIDPPSLIYPVHLSPLSFLLQRGCAEPFSFLVSRIPLLDHSINQWRLVPS